MHEMSRMADASGLHFDERFIRMDIADGDFHKLPAGYFQLCRRGAVVVFHDEDVWMRSSCQGGNELSGDVGLFIG